VGRAAEGNAKSRRLLEGQDLGLCRRLLLSCARKGGMARAESVATGRQGTNVSPDSGPGTVRREDEWTVPARGRPRAPTRVLRSRPPERPCAPAEDAAGSAAAAERRRGEKNRGRRRSLRACELCRRVSPDGCRPDSTYRPMAECGLEFLNLCPPPGRRQRHFGPRAGRWCRGREGASHTARLARQAPHDLRAK
jgi:hypothetical protein